MGYDAIKNTDLRNSMLTNYKMQDECLCGLSSCACMQVVRLVDLLDEARDRCCASLRERRQEQGQAIDEAELLSTATAMGYGAVKYADLRNSRLTNYKFNMDDMLNTKGNTAVYLLYAHARIAGIVRKSGKDVSALAKSETIKLKEPEEVGARVLLQPFLQAVQCFLSISCP
jgi:arginyl-tRNA synthetase